MEGNGTLMKRVFVVAALAVVASTIGIAAQKKVSVTVVNRSDWEIHELYLSSIDEDKWGPDQLGTQIIAAKNGRFKLSGIPVGDYDVKLVDEDEDECVVEGVEIGAEGSEEWVITSKDLLKCQNGR